MKLTLPWLLLLVISIVLGVPGLLSAQSPPAMSYQAVIRDAAGELLVDKAVGLRISILQGRIDGAEVFVEIHRSISNTNGLVSLVIGEGDRVSGDIGTINWAQGPYFLKTETDLAGGSNYTVVGTSQLLSVPYALHAANGLPTGAGEHQILTLCGGEPTWTPGGICPANVNDIKCADAIHQGVLIEGLVAQSVSSTINYSGSNGGFYNAISLMSTGVDGLTLALSPGVLNSGDGSLTFQITGLPASVGTATWDLEIGGLNCRVKREVSKSSTDWPPGYVHCGDSTLVLDVVNPSTGRIWMDRNLGASRVAIDSGDSMSYGDLYQWGRFADGHQCRNSAVSFIRNSIDQPDHGDFIADTIDWRNPQNNNLWQSLIGANNPCPTGYRLPSQAELNAERLSWSSNNAIGAHMSPLKLSTAGFRFGANGAYLGVGNVGRYWTSTLNGKFGRLLLFSSSNDGIFDSNRAGGNSVRCIKNESSNSIIRTLYCEQVTINGSLMKGAAVDGMRMKVPYEGISRGVYQEQVIVSSNVEGLTALLTAGLIIEGQGILTFFLTGTPSSFGVATFTINIGGQSCRVDIPVLENLYRSGTNHCAGIPTAVIEVTNPVTGKIWMDRNLGASRSAQSSIDSEAFGDLYQWGRFADGHQCRNSATTRILSVTDQPLNGDFILSLISPLDWRSPQNNNLWQGLNGINNPCPSGYRIPTETELNTERLSWSTNNAIGAFASPLKLPLSGIRSGNDGLLYYVGSYSFFLSSTINGEYSKELGISINDVILYNSIRVDGDSIRCIKD